MKLGTLDFETYGGFEHESETEPVTPLCCALCVLGEDYGVEEEEFVGPVNAKRVILEYETSRVLLSRYPPCNVVEEVFNYLFDRPEVEQWWAHNAGNFDGLLLHARARGLGVRTEAVLAGGSRVIRYSFTRTSDARTANLYDTFALAPSSLKELAKDFGLPSKLFGADDYKGDMRDLPLKKLREGCQRDARLVGELLKVITTQIEEWGGKRKATFSSSALSIVRANLKQEKGIALPRIPVKINEALRPACFGGRVEVFHHDPGATVDYDVNSSYPSSMSGLLPFEFVSRSGGDRHAGDARYYRLRRVRVDVEACNIPVLPFRPGVNSGIFFPTGVFEGTFTDDELEYAQETGLAKILKVYETFTFTKESPFKTFIEDVYRLKREATGAKKVFTKYVLNGCYGKFGEKPEHLKLVTFPSRADALAWAMEHPGKLSPGENVLSEELFDKNDGTAVLEEFKYAPHAHFAVAATILARSRILLHGHLCGSESASYCDTDSVRCRCYPNVSETDELGGIKRVIDCHRALNYAPKVYRLLDSQGNTLKDSKGKEMIACKGFPVDDESFARMVSLQEVATHRIQKLKTQVKNGMGQTLGANVIKEWSGLSMKRKPFPDGSTRPWTVEELERGEHKRAKCPLLGEDLFKEREQRRRELKELEDEIMAEADIKTP